jgi:hypothetical protein
MVLFTNTNAANVCVRSTLHTPAVLTDPRPGHSRSTQRPWSHYLFPLLFASVLS